MRKQKLKSEKKIYLYIFIQLEHNIAIYLFDHINNLFYLIILLIN